MVNALNEGFLRVASVELNEDTLTQGSKEEPRFLVNGGNYNYCVTPVFGLHPRLVYISLGFFRFQPVGGQL